MHRGILYLNKNAQEKSTPAALFVLLMLVLIIMYVLFIPPEDRNALLNLSDNYGGGENGSLSEAQGGEVLIEEQPGNLFYSKENQVKHALSDIFLVKKIYDERLGRWNSVYVRSGLFIRKSRVLTFYVENASNIGEGQLTFDVEKARGILQIFLNNVLIYEGSLNRGSINPIHIDKGIIKSSNTLVFKALSPGLAFWHYNEFLLENVQLFAQRKEELLKGEQNFFIPSGELSSPRKAIFRFYIECDQENMKEVGVRVNGVLIFNSVPSCGALNQVEFSPSILQEGNNFIEISGESSAYVRDPKILIEMNEPVYPTYYFNLNEADYEKIKSGEARVFLYLSFVTQNNKAEVEINGNKLYVETDDYIYRDITELVKRAGNYITLIPKKNIKVNLLKVFLKSR